jgi:hypothetical protein
MFFRVSATHKGNSLPDSLPIYPQCRLYNFILFTLRSLTTLEISQITRRQMIGRLVNNEL